MGRRKVQKTPEQIAADKLRWWGTERNARRRERYAEDAAYRENAIRQVQASYRKKREESGFRVRAEDCRDRLDALDAIGATRVLRDGCSALTFSEVASSRSAFSGSRSSHR
jgi:hypothetical protein